MTDYKLVKGNPESLRGKTYAFAHWGRGHHRDDTTESGALGILEQNMIIVYASTVLEDFAEKFDEMDRSMHGLTQILESGKEMHIAKILNQSFDPVYVRDDDVIEVIGKYGDIRKCIDGLVIGLRSYFSDYIRQRPNGVDEFLASLFPRQPEN
ncbi:MAG: hypothetical protein ABII01_06035 [Candidatus Woesearchaeota archaeon]